MKKPSARIPLSALDPRYKQILIRGSKEVFEIRCRDSSEAHRFQSALHSYRSRMKEEHKDQPEKWVPLYGCMVTKKTKGSNILVLKPRHDEFENLLSQVDNIEPEGLTCDPLEHL